MKFPGLGIGGLSVNSQIISASVEIRDLMCETTAATINCYTFGGNVWYESAATWSNVNPNSYTTFLSSNSISYANGKVQSVTHRYAFDITEAVRGWHLGNYNVNKGIMFKATSEVENSSAYLYKTFASYNRTSYKPSLSVTYSNTLSGIIDAGK